MEEIEKAAEIIDEKAWINIHMYKEKDKNRSKLGLTLRSESAENPLFLKNLFGGYYSTQAKGEVLYHWWSITVGNAKKVLERVYPLLKKKKIQVDLVFEFEERKKFSSTGAKLPDEELLARKALSARIREFNEIS